MLNGVRYLQNVPWAICRLLTEQVWVQCQCTLW